MNILVDKDAVYGDSPKTELISYRDDLYNKFSRNMMLLLDSKKPRTVFTDKGRLEPRRAYRYKFSNNIFKTNTSVVAGDNTIIFLIDGSGSMDSGYPINRIQKCSAICSAFAKAVNDVTKNELKFEVFIKSAPAAQDSNYGGHFVTLTKVLSNVNKRECDFDRILSVDTRSPLKIVDANTGEEERYVNSYTAEFSVLPGLRKYMMTNLTTKTAIVVNLTDGEPYATIGDEKQYFQFRNRANGQMRVKYLSQVPHVTIIVGGKLPSRSIDSYGPNVVESEDESFSTNLFKMFMGFMEQNYE